MVIIFIILFLTFSIPRSIAVAKSLFGTTEGGLYFAAVTTLTHLLEYLPVFLFLHIFSRTYKVFKSNKPVFFELKGVAYTRKLIINFLTLTAIVALSFSYISHFLTPSLFSMSFDRVRVEIFESILTQPEKLLNQENLSKLTNFFIYSDEKKIASDKINLTNVVVFWENDSSRITRLNFCKEANFSRSERLLKGRDCLGAKKNRGKWEVVNEEKIFVNKKQMRYFYDEHIFKNTISGQLPYFIRKYTYSSAFVIDYLQNKPCPGGSLEIIDRLLYFFSFFYYSFFAFFLARHLRQTRPIELAIWFFGFAIILPAIAIYFRLQNNNPMKILELTWLWPLLGVLVSLLSRFIMRLYRAKYKKSK